MPKVSSYSSPVKSARCRPKVVYRVRNWSAYEAGLKQRGSLTVVPPKRFKLGIIKGPPSGVRNTPFRMEPSKRR